MSKPIRNSSNGGANIRQQASWPGVLDFLRAKKGCTVKPMPPHRKVKGFVSAVPFPAYSVCASAMIWKSTKMRKWANWQINTHIIQWQRSRLQKMRLYVSSVKFIRRKEENGRVMQKIARFLKKSLDRLENWCILNFALQRFVCLKDASGWKKSGKNSKSTLTKAKAVLN